MAYIGTMINAQPILTETAGMDFIECHGRAVKYNADGAVVLAGAGESICGVLVMQTDDEVKAGDLVTIQFKDIAYVRLSGNCAKGNFLSVGAEGKFVRGAVGAVARALEAGKDGWLVPAHISIVSAAGGSGKSDGVLVDSETGKAYRLRVEDAKLMMEEV